MFFKEQYSFSWFLKWFSFLPLGEKSSCKQHPHHLSLKEEASDVVRQKKKYPKKPKAEALITSQQPTPETLPVINKSDIKQYDFHSSDEDEFPQVLVLKLF